MDLVIFIYQFLFCCKLLAVQSEMSACGMNRASILGCDVSRKKMLMKCTFQAPLPNEDIRWTIVYSRDFAYYDREVFECPNPTLNSCTWSRRSGRDRHTDDVGYSFTFFIFDKLLREFLKGSKFKFNTEISDYEACILGHKVVEQSEQHIIVINLSWIVFQENVSSQSIIQRRLLPINNGDHNSNENNLNVDVFAMKLHTREHKFILKHNSYYTFILNITFSNAKSLVVFHQLQTKGS
ncbi:hypothetical protein HELRODRAFT_183975 [Helobdella robusta]|uniref:Uncharacterized protein n=1 Tax=Helobdella robusta TaxID=6412 RepID=T1FKD9_HELRO|nr:hypothetical protein HELRODRAFT_183975 [Helobdella robusta]ESO09657.1 hypothetical protein HELRODRAFT_183975 [Helobdella robusta]